MKSVRVIVRGQVQGVGYRWFTRDAASARQVHGWVRNRSDGGVEAELHGAEDDVDAVLAQMRQGPRHAHVQELVVEAAAGSRRPGFDIRR